MGKFNVLVLTNKTRPPVAIRTMMTKLPVFNPSYEEVIVDVVGLPTSLKKMLLERSVSVIAIDGEYGARDKSLLQELNRMSLSELKLYFTQKKSLPFSVEILRVADALKDKNTRVFFFMDHPSTAMIEVLQKMGATAVWKSLNKLQSNETGLYKIIGGGTEILSGFRTLARSIGDMLDGK